MEPAYELSLETVRDFIVEKGGVVRNHDLVKHFKRFLTRPDNRDDARNYFKEIVNTVAFIRTEGNEKFLVLKKKYRPPSLMDIGLANSPDHTKSSLAGSPSLTPTPGTQTSSSRPQPPPYRPPPPAISPMTSPMSESLSPTNPPPPVPPRRRSSTDKIKLDQVEEFARSMSQPAMEQGEAAEMMDEQMISVKERMQKFNRLASESSPEPVKVSNAVRRRLDKDDDDTSVTTMDPKTREWIVNAARGDYQVLAKLAAEAPRLVRTKDPTSGTALHWAAKHGNKDLVKLIAGTYGLDPNVRTNGGYTPLHIAMQYSHEDIFNLLVDVYSADHNLRDWSGRKPRQYQLSRDTTVSADTFRKIKARKKHNEKESGFLRIGSLNVRVKKTTEAFSNYFLGQSSDKLHKTWGSADNVQNGDKKLMPPPKYGQIRKRKSRREVDFFSGSGTNSRSTPGTPTQQHRISTSSFASLPPANEHDSDSDTAAGFGSNWQN